MLGLQLPLLEGVDAAVIVGGILISHIFTVILIPAMLRLGERKALQTRAPMTSPSPFKVAA